MRIHERLAFSLIELSIAMGVMAILTASISPLIIRQVELKACDKMADEIRLINQAAGRYWAKYHIWPTSGDILKSEGYIGPAWDLQNPWRHPYEVSADIHLFEVQTEVPPHLIEAVKSRIPAASIAGATVTSQINGAASASGGVELGIIVAWSGLISDIPLGWVLCDGSNGTPDLRDKFIVGARADDAGESKTAVLGALVKSGGSISHDHGGKSGEHRLTIAEMPRHHHGYMATPWTGARYDGSSSRLMTEQVASQTDDAGGDQPHTHPIAADEHLPPFYALAFIMRVS